MTNEPTYMACPLCNRSGACPECRGRGVVACVFCDGLGCSDCGDTGTVICLPCDRSGECWRCEGRGYVKLPAACQH